MGQRLYELVKTIFFYYLDVEKIRMEEMACFAPKTFIFLIALKRHVT